MSKAKRIKEVRELTAMSNRDWGQANTRSSVGDSYRAHKRCEDWCAWKVTQLFPEMRPSASLRIDKGPGGWTAEYRDDVQHERPDSRVKLGGGAHAVTYRVVNEMVASFPIPPHCRPVVGLVPLIAVAEMLESAA